MSFEQKNSILIVEDINSDIDVLNHILNKYYTIYVAKTAETALKMAHEYLPDLILLDIILPDRTGFAVLTDLKESCETCNIPIIIITGLNNAQYEEKGLTLGAVDYIMKPFHNAVVLARIKTHMKIVDYIHTIERIGMIDALTGLPNRRCFDVQFSTEWARAVREKTPISLLMIDIDKFKVYNDAHGHVQGDLMLKATSELIANNLKRPGDQAVRYGGDEFVVLLPNTDIEGAGIIAENIRSEIEAQIVSGLDDGVRTSITVGIGIASRVPGTSEECSNLLLEADKYLYEAKTVGKNTIRSARNG